MTRISTSLRRALATAASGALLATSGVPAFAHESAEPAKSQTPSERQATHASADKKICLANTVSGAATVTGSILQKRQCKTRAQWIAEGVQFGRK